ncbi:MAG TPA: hypothetical protein VLF87_00735 [Patescibacteria group bacterium]|nr:hypothetical protein [Candidatus Saccharimonadales bacterium]HSX46503.1 hypothetical protein [Patescibacteria group bacterium]
MDIYVQIAIRIISQQELIIGPVAVQQAQQVDGISVDWANHTVSIVGDEKEAVEELIEAYRDLFGQIAVEASKEAVASLANKLKPEELPDLLK